MRLKKLKKRGSLIVALTAVSIIMASCSASAEHEKDEKAVRAETVEQVNLSDDGSLYINDIIWLDEGCFIDLTRIESYPVIILNYDEKTSVVLENKGKQSSYEIPTTGRYMVFSVENGELKLINDNLAIEYPDAPQSEFILLMNK